MSKLSWREIRHIITEMPDNLVVPRHTEKGHFYEWTPTHEVFGSVTKKTGLLDAPHLKKWAARLAIEFFVDHQHEYEDPDQLKLAAILAHQREFEKAGDVGTIGHGVIDRYLQFWLAKGFKTVSMLSYLDFADSRVTSIALSAELFMREWQVLPIASEMYLASPKHKYAGTLDSLMIVTPPGKKDQEFAIVDWKSSNSIFKVEYAMQTVAYWYALKEMTGLAPKKIYIVRLDKAKIKYEVLEVKNFAKAFRAFRHMCGVDDWLQDTQDKLVPLIPRKKRAKKATTYTDGDIEFTFVKSS